MKVKRARRLALRSHGIEDLEEEEEAREEEQRLGQQVMKSRRVISPRVPLGMVTGEEDEDEEEERDDWGEDEEELDTQPFIKSVKPLFPTPISSQDDSGDGRIHQTQAGILSPSRLSSPITPLSPFVLSTPPTSLKGLPSAGGAVDPLLVDAFPRLYIVLISLHGLVRGSKMELGRDADTGGQVRTNSMDSLHLGAPPHFHSHDHSA